MQLFWDATVSDWLEGVLYTVGQAFSASESVLEEEGGGKHRYS